MTIELKIATESDTPAITALLERSRSEFPHAYRDLLPLLQSGYQLDYIVTNYIRHNTSVVARSGEDVKAFILSCPTKEAGCASIWATYVAPEARGADLFNKIIDEEIKVLSEAGYEAAESTSDPQSAKFLKAKLGSMAKTIFERIRYDFKER